jgi:hypothetical protein
MNRFSDILDIDLVLTVSVRLTAITGNGAPFCQLHINDRELFCDYVCSTIQAQTQVGLTDDIVISVKMSNKIYSIEKETAINIDCVTVDGLDITEHCYSIMSYDNDQQVTANTLYLGFNGDWKIQIPGPFHHWWHKCSGQGWLLTPTASVRD